MASIYALNSSSYVMLWSMMYKGKYLWQAKCAAKKKQKKEKTKI